MEENNRALTWAEKEDPVEAFNVLFVLIDVLVIALKRAKKILGPHSLVSDAMGYAMIESAIERASKILEEDKNDKE